MAVESRSKIMNPGERLLVLIPAYNEEQRIAPMLRDYLEEFEKTVPGQYQLVVVLNGCEDRTHAIVQPFFAGRPYLRVVNVADPIGKGGALIRGLNTEPDADWIAYVDADGATAPQELLRLVALCQDRDCVIGSRWLPGAVLHRQQTQVRRFASRVFHLIVELFFRLKLKDTQCPAKVLSRRAVEAVRAKLKIADLAFDVNLLYALRRAGFAIHEEPTEWTDKAGSQVTRNLFRVSLIMFLSVLRLRLYHSPVYRYLTPFRGIERWIYQKMRAPFIPFGGDGKAR